MASKNKTSLNEGAKNAAALRGISLLLKGGNGPLILLQTA